MSSKSVARVGVIGASLLWVAALFMPWYIESHASADRPLHGAPAFWLLAVGWCVPAWGSVAWFANATFAVSSLTFLQAGRAQVRVALMGSLIALSALLPLPIYDFELGRRDISWISGPAVWTWITASLLNAVALSAYGVSQKRIRSDPESDSPLHS